MKTLEIIVIAYLAISALVGWRLVLIRNHAGRRLGVQLPPPQWRILIFDSLRWFPVVVWYGVKAFIDEMKYE